MTNLTEELQRLNELNAKRTQGEWITEHDEDEGDVTVWAGSAIEERHTGCYDTAGEMRLYSAVYGDSESDAELLANADFIAAAPDAITLCNEYAAENAKLLALLEEAGEALERVRHIHLAAWDNDKINNVLTKLRAAGIGRE